MEAKQNHPADVARVIEFDFVRATEAAALHALKWLGRGDKIAADDAATDAMRGALSLIDMRGRCVIGEGIKDQAPGILQGERLGTWPERSARINFAIDPIDGTRLTARGLPGAISVLAATVVADQGERALAELPSFYSEKLAIGPAAADAGVELDLDAPIEHTLGALAAALERRVSNLVVTLLDRPRNEPLIEQVRATGARIRLIGDGDVAAGIAPSIPGSAGDLYAGIGGSPEAVIAAAAVRSLGGRMAVRMWPRDDAERTDLLAHGLGAELGRTYTGDDLAAGDEIIFAATGISDSPMLAGIRTEARHVHTSSLLIRAKFRTARYVHAIHDLRHKTIHLGSDGKEHALWGG